MYNLFVVVFVCVCIIIITFNNIYNINIKFIASRFSALRHSISHKIIATHASIWWLYVVVICVLSQFAINRFVREMPRTVSSNLHYFQTVFVFFFTNLIIFSAKHRFTPLIYRISCSMLLLRNSIIEYFAFKFSA